MDPRYYGLIEIVLTMGGMIAFAVWQLRSLKRDLAITAERERQRKNASVGSTGPAGHPEG